MGESAEYPQINEGVFSAIGSERAAWFNQLHPPVLERGTLGKLTAIGSGDSGRIYETTRNGEPRAIKFLRPGELVNADFDSAKREFAGLMICNSLCPDVFPRAFGVLLNARGEPFGIEMERVEAENLTSLIDMDHYDLTGEIKLKEGKQPPPKSFFIKLREVITTLAEHNIFLGDWNGGKIMIDAQGGLHIVDVHYDPYDIEAWEKEGCCDVIDEIKEMFGIKDDGQNLLPPEAE